MSGRPTTEGSTADELKALLAELAESRVRLGLEQVRGFVAALDDPQRAAPAVLVAGTNGKGSTCAHLAAILSACGLTTGLYTSPHLESATERIRVDGLAIEPVDLLEALRAVLKVATREGLERPTYFEAMTVAAMLHFVEREVDAVVYEVGLGGRLDATNVVDPTLSVITEIALDHLQMLGDTLPAIAREKAGILRRGVTCCHWISDAGARAAVEDVAAELESPLLDVRRLCEASCGTEAAFEGDRMRVHGQKLHVSAPARGGALPRLANLSLALVAAELFLKSARLGKSEGIAALSREIVESAWESCQWPGRCEWVKRPDGGSLLLDGAHNLHGIEGLLAALEQRRFVALFGALGDKQPQAMAAALAAHARLLVLTRPDSDRSADPAEIAAGLATEGDTQVVADPAAALETALATVTQDELLVVCGSLYLVGEVRGLLRHWWGRPESMSRIYE